MVGSGLHARLGVRCIILPAERMWDVYAGGLDGVAPTRLMELTARPSTEGVARKRTASRAPVHDVVRGSTIPEGGTTMRCAMLLVAVNIAVLAVIMDDR